MIAKSPKVKRVVKNTNAVKEDIEYQFSDNFLKFIDDNKKYSNFKYFDKLKSVIGQKISNFDGTLVDMLYNDGNTITYTPTSKLIKLYKEEVKLGKHRYTFKTWVKTKAKTKKFWKENRTEIKIGKFLERIIDAQNNELEEITGLYKSYSSKYTFEIVYGDDIVKYYDINYQELTAASSSLKNSCMRYRGGGSISSAKKKIRLSFYAKNKKVGLLVLKNNSNGLIKGRALIWTLDDNTKYIDRVYTDSFHDESIYLKYAKDNNFSIYINTNDRYSKKTVSCDDIVLSAFDQINFSIPYLDSFYYEKDKNKLLCRF